MHASCPFGNLPPQCAGGWLSQACASVLVASARNKRVSERCKKGMKIRRHNMKTLWDGSSDRMSLDLLVWGHDCTWAGPDLCGHVWLSHAFLAMKLGDGLAASPSHLRHTQTVIKLSDEWTLLPVRSTTSIKPPFGRKAVWRPSCLARWVRSVQMDFMTLHKNNLQHTRPRWHV